MGKYRRLIVIGILLGLLAFIAVTLLSDVNQLIKYALTFPWVVMVLPLGLRTINWGTRYIKWSYYLRLVGVKGLSRLDGLTTFLSGLAMAASPGKLAELLKCFIIRNLTGTSVASTIPTIIAERLTDGVGVLLLTAVAISQLAAPEYLPVVTTSLVLIVIGVVILSIRPLCLAILRFTERLPVIGRFAEHFLAFYESSFRIIRPVPLFLAISSGVVGNFGDGIGMFIILTAMGRPPTMTTFFEGLLAVTFSVITGSLSGSPGGIGASDLTITGVLQHVAGLSLAEAGFATLLARIVQLWWGVLVGLVVSVLFRKRLFPANLNTTTDQPTAAETAEMIPAR